MPSTYSPLLRFEEIGSGEQSGLWGDTTNKNIGELIEQAVAGVTTVSLSGTSDVTLSALDGALDQSRSAVLKFIGSPSGPINIIIPTSQKLYVVRNECGQSIRVKTLAQPVLDAVVLKDDEASLVFCDGSVALRGIQTEGVGTLAVPGGGTGATTFTAGFIKSPGGTGNLFGSATVSLTSDVSNVLPIANGGTGSNNTAYCSLTSNVVNTLPVANGGTGAAAFTANGLLRESGGVISSLVGGANGQVATWNGSSWVAATPATGGVNSVSSGGNITVSPTTGSVVISLSGANVTSALGYTPGNVATNASNTYTTGLNSYGVNANISMAGANKGDQRITVNGGGFSSGMSPIGIQTGLSQHGLIYTSGTNSVDIILPTYIASFRAAGAFQSNNSPNWATVSDFNIKTNLRPISSVLDKINALKPCHFEYKDKLGEVQTGFVAQEFATVFPGHTMDTPVDDVYKKFLPEGETNLKAIDTNLTAYLVKAIQELSAKVDAQAVEIAALKAK